MYHTANNIVTGPPSGDETDVMQGAQPGIDDALDTFLVSLDGVDTIPARWRRWRSGTFLRRYAAHRDDHYVVVCFAENLSVSNRSALVPLTFGEL